MAVLKAQERNESVVVEDGLACIMKKDRLIDFKDKHVIVRAQNKLEDLAA